MALQPPAQDFVQILLINQSTQKRTAEVTGNSAQTAQNISRKKECTIVEGTFASTAKKTHKTGDKKICEEYEMEVTILSKMRLEKCGAYTVKETLGCRGRKTYISPARGAAKREKP